MKKIGLFYATKAERTSWVAEKIQKEFGEDKEIDINEIIKLLEENDDNERKELSL